MRWYISINNLANLQGKFWKLKVGLLSILPVKNMRTFQNQRKRWHRGLELATTTFTERVVASELHRTCLEHCWTQSQNLIWNKRLSPPSNCPLVFLSPCCDIRTKTDKSLQISRPVESWKQRWALICLCAYMCTFAYFINIFLQVFCIFFWPPDYFQLYPLYPALELEQTPPPSVIAIIGCYICRMLVPFGLDATCEHKFLI